VTIIRENTEGFYPDRNLAWGYGEFKATDDVALSLRVITGVACDRFARYSLDYAAAQGESVLHILGGSASTSGWAKAVIAGLRKAHIIPTPEGPPFCPATDRE
jgi:3-isopropylmalate dehydrogenase